eukprot:3977103-Alexandrium_andersonii.AAC.1
MCTHPKQESYYISPLAPLRIHPLILGGPTALADSRDQRLCRSAGSDRGVQGRSPRRESGGGA